jgi:hypothetical protein
MGRIRLPRVPRGESHHRLSRFSGRGSDAPPGNSRSIPVVVAVITVVITIVTTMTVVMPAAVIAWPAVVAGCEHQARAQHRGHHHHANSGLECSHLLAPEDTPRLSRRGSGNIVPPIPPRHGDDPLHPPPKPRHPCAGRGPSGRAFGRYAGIDEVSLSRPLPAQEQRWGRVSGRSARRPGLDPGPLPSSTRAKAQPPAVPGRARDDARRHT